MNLVRVIAEDGSMACIHRDLSVCDACWKATPGLVDVFDVVYQYDPADWDNLAGLDMSPSPRRDSESRLAELRES